MRSMTGYGEAAAQGAGCALRVRVRTVNARGLDVRLHLPSAWDTFAADMTRLVRAVVERGRVDVTAELDVGRAGSEAALREVERLERWTGPLDELRFRLNWSAPMTIDTLLRAEAVLGAGSQPRPEDDVYDLLLAALEEALEQLDRARRREGEQLRAFFREAHQALVSHGEAMDHLTARMEAALRERWVSRLEELRTLWGAGAPTEDRWLGELVMQLQRADVREEIHRYRVHVGALGELLVEGADGTRGVGRRIELLCQELQRECATLSAKATSTELSHRMVDVRLLVEQVREQAANVE